VQNGQNVAETLLVCGRRYIGAAQFLPAR
jgi:hypothetical protein